MPTSRYKTRLFSKLRLQTPFRPVSITVCKSVVKPLIMSLQRYDTGYSTAINLLILLLVPGNNDPNYILNMPLTLFAFILDR